MTTEEYFAIPFPTDEDFRAWTRDFFAWAREVQMRVAAKYPQILRKKAEEVFPLLQYVEEHQRRKEASDGRVSS